MMTTKTIYKVIRYYGGCQTSPYETSSREHAAQRTQLLQDDNFIVVVDKVVTTTEDVTKSVRESLHK